MSRCFGILRNYFQRQRKAKNKAIWVLEFQHMNCLYKKPKTDFQIPLTLSQGSTTEIYRGVPLNFGMSEFRTIFREKVGLSGQVIAKNLYSLWLHRCCISKFFQLWSKYMCWCFALKSRTLRTAFRWKSRTFRTKSEKSSLFRTFRTNGTPEFIFVRVCIFFIFEKN